MFVIWKSATVPNCTNKVDGRRWVRCGWFVDSLVPRLFGHALRHRRKIWQPLRLPNRAGDGHALCFKRGTTAPPFSNSPVSPFFSSALVVPHFLVVHHGQLLWAALVFLPPFVSFPPPSLPLRSVDNKQNQKSSHHFLRLLCLID